MYRAAILDMDGLLIDSERAIMRHWLEAADECGNPLEVRHYLDAIGRRAEESDRILREVLGSRFDVVKSKVDAKLTATDGSAIFPLKPGVAQFMFELSARQIPCGVASSTETAEVRRRLQSVGILHYFSVVVGGDTVERGKPDPGVYLLAANLLEMKVKECVAFEDSDNGVAAAHAAGIDVILVPDVKVPSERSRALCHGELTSMTQATPKIDGWFVSST